MKLTKDESRALAFVAFLLVLSAAARYAKTPAPITAAGPEVDLKALEQASQAKLDSKRRSRAGGRTRARGTLPRREEPPESVAASPRRPLAASGRGPTGSGGPVIDINTATAEELESVPGIGPGLARRILAEKAKKGRFEQIDDLLAVKGIGPATLGRLRGYLTVRP